MRICTAALLVYLCFPFIVHSQEDSSDLKIFETVEKEAAYPGGETAWKKFLERNLNPNVPVDNGAPTGVYTVFVQFVVNKNGGVSDVKALTKIGYGMETEVLRILRKSGLWEPAVQDGRTVNAYRKQPVTFMLTEDGFDISPYSISADQDSEISIEVDKVKNEDLDVRISRGTITRNANGKFIAHVKGTERVIITVYNRKKNKQVGIASIEVK